jgi:hypothetical protein
LFERIVALDAEKAYSELKNQLFRQNSKLIIDEPPQHLVVEQGSLFGLTPKGAKKRIECHFHPQGDHTRIVAKTSLSSNWKKVTCLGYLIGAVCIALAILLAFTVQAIATQPYFLSIFTEFGSYNYSQLQLIANMLWGLAIFLVSILSVNIIADLLIYRRKDSLIEETLKMLP